MVVGHFAGFLRYCLTSLDLINVVVRGHAANALAITATVTIMATVTTTATVLALLHKSVPAMKALIQASHAS